MFLSKKVMSLLTIERNKSYAIFLCILADIVPVKYDENIAPTAAIKMTIIICFQILYRWAICLKKGVLGQVDGHTVRGLTPTELSQIIAGPEGTWVPFRSPG